MCGHSKLVIYHTIDGFMGSLCFRQNRDGVVSSLCFHQIRDGPVRTLYLKQISSGVMGSLCFLAEQRWSCGFTVLESDH